MRHHPLVVETTYEQVVPPYGSTPLEKAWRGGHREFGGNSLQFARKTGCDRLSAIAIWVSAQKTAENRSVVPERGSRRRIGDLESLCPGLYDGVGPLRRRGPLVQHLGTLILGLTMTPPMRKSPQIRVGVPSGDAPRMADDDRKRRNEPGGPGTAAGGHYQDQTADQAAEYYVSRAHPQR